MSMLILPAAAARGVLPRRLLPRVAARQARGCMDANTEVILNHLQDKVRHLEVKRGRIHREGAESGMSQEELKQLDADTRSQLQKARQHITNVRLYGVSEHGLEAVARDEQGIPQMNDPYMSRELAEEVGVRDVREDAAIYETALDTLKERGMDVKGLFTTVGCPAPFAVFLHLLTKHKHNVFTLGDRDVAAVLTRMAAEMKATARRTANDPSAAGDLPNTLAQAMSVRDACLDNQIPFEYTAHAALLKVAAFSGDLDAACDVFKEIVTLVRPDDYGALIHVALAAGEAEFAADLLAECIEKYPRAVKEHSELAASAIEVYATLGDAEKLKEVQADSGGEADPVVNRHVFKALCNRGMWTQATEFYDRVLAPAEGARKGARSPEVIASLLLCAERIGDMDRMVALVEEAAEQHQRNQPQQPSQKRLGATATVTLAHIHALVRGFLYTRGAVDGAMTAVRLAHDFSIALTADTGALLAAGVLHAVRVGEGHSAPVDVSANDDAAFPMPSATDIEEIWSEVAHPRHSWKFTSEMVSDLVEAAARGAVAAAAKGGGVAAHGNGNGNASDGDSVPANPHTAFNASGGAGGAGAAEVWVRLAYRILHTRSPRAAGVVVSDDALAALLLAGTRAHSDDAYFLDTKEYLALYRQIRSPSVAAKYGLAEALQTVRRDYGVVLKLLRDAFPNLEAQVVPPHAVAGGACMTLGELAQSVRGLSKVYVLSSLNLLREHPAAATDCSKLLIPFSLLAREVLAGADDIHDFLALPHVDIIRVPEQVLAHAAADALGVLPQLDLSLQAHRCLCFAMALQKVARGHGCGVEVLAGGAGAGAEGTNAVADALGVTIRRI